MFEGVTGPDLAAALAEADVATLTDDGVLDTIAGWERVSRWAAGMSLAAVDELEKRRPGRDAEFVQDEVALALRISRIAAGGRLLLASQLRRLPGVRAALRAGDLDVTKARIVADAVQPLDDAAATRVQQRVLPRAVEQTPGQLRAACERAVLHADPAAAARRHDHALRDRGVRLIVLGDGMAELSLRHTADRITALYNSIDTLARHARSASDDDRDGESDTRTLDQRRADTMVDLAELALDDARLLPTGPTAPEPEAPASASGARSPNPAGGPDAFVRPTPHRAGRPPGRRRDVLVHVVIPVGTLLGVTDQPGELPGYGPIPAELARRVAADATWQRIFTDPLTGRLTHVDRGAYTPPPSVAEHVRTRDQTCRFPGCRRAARWCDLDHRVPYPHGPTCVCNLCCLCRHHHRLKQHPHWRFEETDDDVYVWTSPTGSRYLTEPPPLLDVPEILPA
jgi:Domain of unknown function (DUF222)